MPGSRGSPPEPERGARGLWRSGGAFAENMCCVQDVGVPAVTGVNLIRALSQKRLLERDSYN